MDKVNRTSMAVNDERLKQLMDLFPEAISEGKIDFDKLRQALGEHIDSRPERYSFTWAGKRDAMQAAQIPSRATLVPDREASVNFDETQNVFIEGDNLEVLKLLARPYFGRVKMIYIDPPYNTGNDFVYPDNYADPLDAYLRMTGQKTGNGDLLTTNAETNGRFHSSWLSMMYPRLQLARQLLRDDGVILVSIDYHEIYHLRMLLNELFGEENFVATFVWKRRASSALADKNVSIDHEYVVAYKRTAFESFRGRPKDYEGYSNPDNDPEGPWTLGDLTVGMTKEQRPNQFYDLVDPTTGQKYPANPNRVWAFIPESMKKEIEAGRVVFPDDPSKRPMVKRYKKNLNSDVNPISTWIRDMGDKDEEEETVSMQSGLNAEATRAIRELFGENVFEYSKPLSLLKSLIENIAEEDGDIVLDFFAGSAATAQAVLELNREDSIYRRFIMIQLPEKTERDDFPTIVDIGRERIRRVIQTMQEDKNGKMEGFEQHPGEDLGFRAFSLTESNYSPDPDPEALSEEAYAEQLALWADSLLVDGWDATDVIYEVALKEGYGLNIRVEEVSVENNTVYHVADPDKEQSFYICLDETLRTDIIDVLGLTPDDLFICHDKALDDTLAANLALQARLQTL